MIHSKKLSFQSGHVLTGEMLQELQDFPRLFVNARYEDYGDGILCGFSLQSTEDGIVFSPGLLKLKGKIYSSDDSICISFNELDKEFKTAWYAMVLRKQTEVCKGDINISYLEIKYVTQENIEKDDFVLLLIPRNVGKRRLPELNLKSSDNDYFKQFKSGGWCKVSYSCHACLDGSTYMPIIFNAVRRYLEFKQNKCMQDYALLLELQNNTVVSNRTIKSYIEDAGITLDSETDLTTLFPKFLEALTMMRRNNIDVAAVSNQETTKKEPNKNDKTIIVWGLGE